MIVEKSFKANITQSYNFTIEDINDLVVTALEGGINYWCSEAKIVKEDGKYKGVSPDDLSKVEFASDVIGNGGELQLTDAEDPELIFQLHCDWDSGFGDDPSVYYFKDGKKQNAKAKVTYDEPEF